MEMTLITIKGDLAHFKSTLNPNYQSTSNEPPISTVIGIIKNIYGKGIRNFIFGFNFSYEEKILEFNNQNKIAFEGKADKNGNAKTPNIIEYLTDPKLEIITNIDSDIELHENLNLGKTNCMCNLSIKKVKIKKISIPMESVVTSFEDGQGVVRRITIETEYNKIKGLYKQHYGLIRVNEEYECEWSYEDKGFYLWNYKGMGDVECYKE